MPFIVKKTLVEIINSGNDYLVKVKRNQPALLKEMEKVRKSHKELSQNIQKEVNRGRKEIRTIKTYEATPWISTNWPAAKTVVYAERNRQIHNAEIITQSYFLSSLSIDAKEFARGIRHHWGIENRLHYVKDVTFKEDDSKIRQGQAPGIFSLIRNLVLNIIRLQGENRIKRFLRRNAGNIELIHSYLE
jgi:predicted transposase YbfD/YdcC